MSKPVIVQLPGSFCRPSFYDRVTQGLEKNGVEVATPALPSCGRRDPLPAATVADDVEAIQAAVSKYVDRGETVVLVTHSYSGLPGSDAVEGLSVKTRKGQGLQGGISRLVHVSSVAVPVGTTMNQFHGSGGRPDFLSLDGDYMKSDPTAMASLCFLGVPEKEALELAEQMPEHSLPSFHTPTTYPGWKDVDVSWVFCDDDVLGTPDRQQASIDFLEQDMGRKVDVHHIKAGHFPQASRPDEYVELLMKILEKSGP